MDRNGDEQFIDDRIVSSLVSWVVFKVFMLVIGCCWKFEPKEHCVRFLLNRDVGKIFVTGIEGVLYFYAELMMDTLETSKLLVRLQVACFCFWYLSRYKFPGKLVLFG